MQYGMTRSNVSIILLHTLMVYNFSRSFFDRVILSLFDDFSVFFILLYGLDSPQHLLPVPRGFIMQSDGGINVVVGVVVVLHHREHFEGLLGIEGIGVAVGGVFGDSPHLVHVHRGDLQATEVVILPHRERIPLRFGVNEGELEDLVV